MRAGCGADPGVCVCCYRGMEQILWLLPKHRQPVLVRYGVSAAIILVCCAVQYAIYRVAGFAGLFLLLPGIFATALGALVSIYLMFPAWPALDAPVVVPIVLFLLTGVAMAMVSEGLRMALERIVKAEREKDLLLRELRHRTKNDIMNIGSILRLQARRASAEEVSNALAGAAQRVEVMAEVHDFLRDKTGTVEMDRYLGELCRRLGDSLRGVRPIAIRVEADNVELSATTAVPIGIIANELVTNCLKYAFPGDRAGTIVVKLRRDGEIQLVVEDDGVGCGEDIKEGSGSMLMQLLTRQLGGTMNRTNGSPGCRVEVRLPA